MCGSAEVLKYCFRNNKDKGKGVPQQARCGPEGSRRFRLPDFMTFSTWRWWGCQPHAPAARTPQKCSCCLFSLGAEGPQGHGMIGRKYVTEKSSDTTGNLSRDHPTSSAPASLPLYPRPHAAGIMLVDKIKRWLSYKNHWCYSFQSSLSSHILSRNLEIKDWKIIISFLK